METIILVVFIITIAFFGESIFGFGSGLIAIPLLSLIIGVKDAVILMLIFQLLMGLLIWKSYKQIDWKLSRPMTISIVTGTIIGMFLLSKSSAVFLQLFLAISIIVFLIRMIWFNGFIFSHKLNKIISTLTGLVSGLLQGIIGTGGPILTMYLSVAIKEKPSLRSTLIYLLFVTSIVRLVIYIPGHLFNDYILQLAGIALLPFLIAIFVGQHMHHKIGEKYYRLGIYIILTGSAILLLSKSIPQL